MKYFLILLGSLVLFESCRKELALSQEIEGNYLVDAQETFIHPITNQSDTIFTQYTMYIEKYNDDTVKVFSGNQWLGIVSEGLIIEAYSSSYFLERIDKNSFYVPYSHRNSNGAIYIDTSASGGIWIHPKYFAIATKM